MSEPELSADQEYVVDAALSAIHAMEGARHLLDDATDVAIEMAINALDEVRTEAVAARVVQETKQP